MATRLGNDRMLWVETSTPGQFVCVGGQGNFSRSISRSAMSTANKASGWDTERAGFSKGKADVDLIPDLPDAGYARLQTLCKAEPQAPFLIQVRKNGTAGAAPGDVEFACSVTCDSWSDEAPQNDVVKAKAGFLMAAAPTVDTLL